MVGQWGSKVKKAETRECNPEIEVLLTKLKDAMTNNFDSEF